MSNVISTSALAQVQGGVQAPRNQEATLFVGELDSQVHEALLWELFQQVAPVGE